jgi:hypothetical protein
MVTTTVPSAAGEWLAATLPNGRFAAVAGAAHVPFLSHPAEFGAALGAFLAMPADPPRSPDPLRSIRVQCGGSCARRVDVRCVGGPSAKWERE